jgi:hypothetical protein
MLGIVVGVVLERTENLLAAAANELAWNSIITNM